jgi:hypothetical protein
LIDECERVADAAWALADLGMRHTRTKPLKIRSAIASASSRSSSRTVVLMHQSVRAGHQ